MSFPKSLQIHEHNLYLDINGLGKIYIGHASYIFEGTKKKWEIEFAESTPKGIKERLTRIFIHETDPDSPEIILGVLRNFDRVLYNDIFEPHSEEESYIAFPEKHYKKIEDPIIRQFVKDKISEWTSNEEYFTDPIRKKYFRDLLEKLEKIDKGA